MNCLTRASAASTLLGLATCGFTVLRFNPEMKQRTVGVGDSTGPIFDQRLVSEPLSPAPGHCPRGRIFSGLVAAAVLLFLASCTPTSIDPPPVFDVPQPPAPAVSSSVSYQPPGDVHLSTLRSVSVTFTLIGAGANDLATVEFVSPSGTPYETRPAPLTGTASDQQQLEFSLPVGGTLVETAQMTGTWKAVLLINGQAAAAPAFDINP